MTVTKKTAPIPEVFDSLIAEREGEWLHDLYIRPEHFLSMAGSRSFILFGGEGAGKTALRIALQRYSAQTGSAAPLAIHWRPDLDMQQGDARQIVREFMKQLMSRCAQEILYYAYRNPHNLKNAQPWTQEAAAWFAQTFLAEDWRFEIERLNAEFQGQDIDGVQTLLSQNARPLLFADAPAASVLTKVAFIVKGLGAGGVQAYVDGMEILLDQDKEALVNTIRSLLSTLALFEEPGFVIKMMAPEQIEGDLLSANSTIRRRWEVFHLKWSNAQLVEMIETRAAAMLGKGSYKIKDLCSAKELQEQFEKLGGTSPRGWLKSAHALLEYQQTKNGAPLSLKELNAVSYQNLPSLRIDLATDKVFIGYGEISALQPLAKKILRYIYALENKTCSREELYYRAHQEFDVIPKSSKDDHWVGRAQWEKSIDTALYRIRQIIEPDPKNPVYLISDTGKGIVRLNNVG